MHALIRHRQQRLFDEAQSKRQWRQMVLPRRTEDTRIAILGLGEIGGFVAQRFVELDFPYRAGAGAGKIFPG